MAGRDEGRNGIKWVGEDIGMNNVYTEMSLYGEKASRGRGGCGCGCGKEARGCGMR